MVYQFFSFFPPRLVHQELLQRRCKAEFKDAVHLNKFLSLLNPFVIPKCVKRRQTCQVFLFGINLQYKTQSVRSVT